MDDDHRLHAQCCKTVRGWWLRAEVVERTDQEIVVAVWTRWSKLIVHCTKPFLSEEECVEDAQQIYFAAACRLLYWQRLAGKPGVPPLPTGHVGVSEEWSPQELTDPQLRARAWQQMDDGSWSRTTPF